MARSAKTAKIRKYHDEGNIWEEDSDYYDEDHDRKPKAPIMLRVLAWGGVILLCFVGGYIGASYGINLLNKQNLLIQKDVVSTSNDLKTFIESDKAVGTAQTQGLSDIRKTTVKLSYLKEDVLTTEPFEIIPNLREDDIREVIEKSLTLSKMFTKEVSVKHIFRNAGTLYLDMTGPFIPMLGKAGRDKSSLFITGLVRTMKDNFAPISELRFLVNGTVSSAGSPVDLTAVWSLPQ